MSASSLLPSHESLRRAVAWLSLQGRWTAEIVDEASRRFDLSPTDEEFLLQACRQMNAGGTLPDDSKRHD